MTRFNILSMSRFGQALIVRPWITILMLSVLVAVLEALQYWPEVFLGAHVVSVFVRNVGYSLIGAVIFAWVAIEIPNQRRAKATLRRHELSIGTLAMLGAIMVQGYRLAQYPNDESLDSWNRQAIHERALLLSAHYPDFFGEPRVSLIRSYLLASDQALLALRDSLSFLDEDVAHAIAQYPSSQGLSQLQISLDEKGRILAERDAHITWELLEGGRRICSALRMRAPWMKLVPATIQTNVGNFPISMSDIFESEIDSERVSTG